MEAEGASGVIQCIMINEKPSTQEPQDPEIPAIL